MSRMFLSLKSFVHFLVLNAPVERSPTFYFNFFRRAKGWKFEKGQAKVDIINVISESES